MRPDSLHIRPASNPGAAWQLAAAVPVVADEQPMTAQPKISGGSPWS